jgi:hypothetical protein
MYLTIKANRADYSKKIAVKVPLSIAKDFATNLDEVIANPIFDFQPNQIVLTKIEAKYQGQTMLAQLNNTDFKPEKIMVAIQDKKANFNGIKQLDLTLQNPNLTDKYQIQALAYRDGKEIQGNSFDDDIPQLLAQVPQAKIDNRKWLFIIGIENYKETDNIAFARRSAKMFKKVAKKVLGISERHSYTLIDNGATGMAIKDRLKMLLSEVKYGDKIYFYYNGHGIPNQDDNSFEPFLLPSDGIPDFITDKDEFALKNIYLQLSNSKAGEIIAFVDSCFAGSTDGVSIIKGVANSRLRPKKIGFDKSKMVVMSAGQKLQFSNMYQKRGHRLFTYFLMKSIISGKKDTKSVFKEVSYKVSEVSDKMGKLKKQEPTIDGNYNIGL